MKTVSDRVTKAGIKVLPALESKVLIASEAGEET